MNLKFRRATGGILALATMLTLTLVEAAVPREKNGPASALVGKQPWDEAAAGGAGQGDGWAARHMQFQVLLDGKPIGTHRFDLIRDGGRLWVRSDARYQVKWLFFNAYSYRHAAREVWEQGCLKAIRSTTEDDGESYVLDGQTSGAGLHLVVNGASTEIDEPCLRSFAYWDRALLSSDRLLNPQTGQLEPVEVLVDQAVDGQGRDRPDWLPDAATQNLRLVTDAIPIDLWYDSEGRWLALEARLEAGRILRYIPAVEPGSPADGAGDPFSPAMDF